MQAYPAYIDSDVEWIGDIPVHWSNTRIKSVVASVVNGVWGDDPQGDANDIICVRVADFDMQKLGIGTEKLTLRNIPEGQQAGRLLEHDDLLVEKSGGGDLQPVGRVVRFDLNKKAVSSNFIGKISVNKAKVLPVFLLYYLNHLYSKEINTRSIKQTTGIQNLDTYSYMSERILLPPLSEQQAIVDFLDCKTAQIDTLIEKKQRQIDLLQEQRIALINQVVTKGQDRNDIRQGFSPAPWLFTLPSGWKRQDLKFNSYMKGRIGYQNLRSDEYTEEGPYLVSSVHFKDGRIEWDKCNHVTRERFEMAPEIIIQEHDVLFMKDGALMGKLAYVDNLPGEACLNSHLLLMRPLNNAYLPRFLYYVLMTDIFEAYMVQERNGTTFFGFSQQSMGNFPISLPPIDEQAEICNYLDEQTEKTKLAIQRVEDEMSKLREYRTALISEAVTGKIDVR